MLPLLKTRRHITVITLALACATPLLAAPAQPAADTPAIRPVSILKAKTENWPDRIEASGNIMPWQESRISTEIGALRLASVLVNEGDTVRKGQVLARLDSTTIEIDRDVADAQRVEAEAVLAQAVATLERANRLAPSGGVSRQELTLYETQKHTAEARLNAARAQLKRQQIKMELATINAPDDGLISSCTATEGSIVQAGSELFRLIRKARLEWQAEISGNALLRLSTGQEVVIKSPLGAEVKGRVRRASPTVDLATHNGLVYVDLPPGSDLKAGLNVSGSINLGKHKALVIPASAIQKQGSVSRILKLDADNRIESSEIQTGRTRGDWVEVLSGLDENTQFVGKDIAQFKEGDQVRP